MKPYKIWYDQEHGVIYAQVFDTWSKKDVEEAFPFVQKLMEENQCRSFLANISQNRQGFVDQEARKALKQFSDTLKFDKVAVTGANPATRMIMKIASSIMGISKITRFLKTDEEALAWLKE